MIGYLVPGVDYYSKAVPETTSMALVYNMTHVSFLVPYTALLMFLSASTGSDLAFQVLTE